MTTSGGFSEDERKLSTMVFENPFAFFAVAMMQWMGAVVSFGLVQWTRLEP
jgi:hypothetical protein